MPPRISLKGAAMPQGAAVHDPRVVLRRESLWCLDGGPYVPPPIGPGLKFGPMWSVFLRPATFAAFEVAAEPLLESLASTSPSRLIVVRLVGATFEPVELRRVVDAAGVTGVPVMAQVVGLWSMPSLQILGAIRPAFIRVADEWLHGIGVLPEQVRRLARLVEHFGAMRIPVVAEGLDGDDDQAAARSAGIELAIRTDSPVRGDPWAEPETSGSAAGRPVVLDFPLRPPPR